MRTLNLHTALESVATYKKKKKKIVRGQITYKPKLQQNEMETSKRHGRKVGEDKHGVNLELDLEGRTEC